MGSNCSVTKTSKNVQNTIINTDFASPRSVPENDIIASNEHGTKRKSIFKSKNNPGKSGKTAKFDPNLPGDGNVPKKEKKVEFEEDIRQDEGREESFERLGDTNLNTPKRVTVEYQKGPCLVTQSPYAEVCECLNLNDGKRLAVKCYKSYGQLSELAESIEELQREINLLMDIEHPNLIKYYGAYTKESEDSKHTTIDVVMEFASGGSVWKLINNFNALDERVVKYYTRQLLEGLSCLHSYGIIHRNLKASNMLIDTFGTIKLTDIESVNMIKYALHENLNKFNKEDLLADFVYWAAPELLINQPSGNASDIWSVGCVIVEMLTGMPPWGGYNVEDACKLIIDGDLPPIPEELELSESCVDLLQKIFQMNPEDRPTIDDLLEHPFLHDRNSDNSSMFESFHTMKSFNFLKTLGGLQSYNSFGRNAGDGFNRHTSIANPAQMRKAAMAQNFKSNSNEHSRSNSPERAETQKENFYRNDTLSRVHETNPEDEESSAHRDLRNSLRQQQSSHHQANQQPQKPLYMSYERQRKSPVKQRKAKKHINYPLRKSKTEDLGVVSEDIDQEEFDDIAHESQNSQGLRFDSEDVSQEEVAEESERQTKPKPSQKKRRERANQSYTPIRISIFKSMQTEEIKYEFGDEEGEGDYKAAQDREEEEEEENSDASQDNQQNDKKAQEDQRMKAEADLWKQLQRIQTRDLRENSDDTFRFPESVTSKSNVGKRSTLRTKTDAKKAVDIKRKYQVNLKKRYEVIHSRTFGADAVARSDPGLRKHISIISSKNDAPSIYTDEPRHSKYDFETYKHLDRHATDEKTIFTGHPVRQDSNWYDNRKKTQEFGKIAKGR